MTGLTAGRAGLPGRSGYYVGMRLSPLTKPGRHGTLYRYWVEYTDDDPCFGKAVWKVWAYSVEHALEKFHGSDEGFTPTRYARALANADGNAAPENRQTWHAVAA